MGSTKLRKCTDITCGSIRKRVSGPCGLLRYDAKGNRFNCKGAMKVVR